jgi:NAD(P)-dependent dehydrogenase (short-subunit alcohol dehydrogenase family)
MSFSLENKRIIVTGGAQGIGEATVRAYAREGARLFSFDLNAESGQKVAAESTAAGPGSVHFRTVDVADRAAVDSAVDEAVGELGGLDVFVNVAGLQQSGLAGSISDELWERVYRVNVLGTIHTNQAAFRHMKPNTAGSIVNFGSMSGFVGELGNSVYGSSKGAVHTWTRTAAREWGPFGVTVNAVLPYVTTPMFDKFRSSLTPEELQAYDDEIIRTVPLGRLGNADRDLAPVMIFLASEASHFITGQLIPVDGGLSQVR